MRLLVLLAAAVLATAPALAFDLQGHRGARGLAPENTLAAIDQALAIGVDTLELDLVVTADDVLVVHHDLTLNGDIARGPDGAWVTGEVPLRSLTLDVVKTFDVGRLRAGSEYALRFADQITRDGARIPTLDEVFARVAALGADHVRFNLETKISPSHPAHTPAPDAFAALLAEAIRAHGLVERVSVQSFDWRTLDAMAEIAPEIVRVCLTAQGRFDTVRAGEAGASPWLGGRDVDDADGSAPALAAQAGCAVWSPHHGDVDADRLAEAKGLGLAVVPWTVNEIADMRRLVDLGVDGLITDYPNRLRALLVERGIETAPQVRLPTR
ncbi:glycerophosphodiester phosphodiesterase [Salinarimonas ramus]|uniref:Glycerophosphoryl diester phosphodiesterase n=1 Tax=Salinarimonas ramus TaxID=690164 RepID=A0A917Q5N3_9HYPH|nr:glycerophosphodiester phosphodiesterase [Salinarimonas ramus]GGK26823.1 glycerophosphoryl diester phosphodiesterase [Salinarimonas ramus]